MKRLFKKSAVLVSALVLFLFPILRITAAAVEIISSDTSFVVQNAIGREGAPIQVDVEASLIRDNQIEYLGRRYSTQDFASFLVRNLLVGPYSNTVTRVEFCEELPTHYAPFERISMTVVDGGSMCVVVNDGTTAVVVCDSIDSIGIMDIRAHARNLFM